MDIHKIKIWPEHYFYVEKDEKKAELRIMDRDYKVGDILKLNEWKGRYTGRHVFRRITHILKFKREGDQMWGILSIGKVRD